MGGRLGRPSCPLNGPPFDFAPDERGEFSYSCVAPTRAMGFPRKYPKNEASPTQNPFPPLGGRLEPAPDSDPGIGVTVRRTPQAPIASLHQTLLV